MEVTVMLNQSLWTLFRYEGHQRQLVYILSCRKCQFNHKLRSEHNGINVSLCL